MIIMVKGPNWKWWYSNFIHHEDYSKKA